jgi:hypothetical protein
VRKIRNVAPTSGTRNLRAELPEGATLDRVRVGSSLTSRCLIDPTHPVSKWLPSSRRKRIARLSTDGRLPAPRYRNAHRRTAPTQVTETAGVFVVLRGLRGLRAGAPDTIRTCDLGFRKRSRPRGVAISYRTVTIGVSMRRSAFRRTLRFARYQRVTINAFDGRAQVVGVEVGVAPFT